MTLKGGVNNVAKNITDFVIAGFVFRFGCVVVCFIVLLHSDRRHAGMEEYENIRIFTETKMKLTKKKAIKITIELWTWLATTGSGDKSSWPGWGKYDRMFCSCPLCEYGDQRRQARKRYKEFNPLNICRACPFFIQHGRCTKHLPEIFLDGGATMWAANPSYYDKWYRSGTAKTRKKYAKLFLNQTKELR